MIHPKNDPSLGYYVVNTTTGFIVFHEPSQKIKPHEREATEEDFATAPDAILIHAGRKEAPPLVEKPIAPMSLPVSVKATGTVG